MSGRRAKKLNKRNRAYRIAVPSSDRNYRLVRVSRREGARVSIVLDPPRR